MKSLRRFRTAVKSFSMSWSTSSPWPEWRTSRGHDAPPDPGEPWRNSAVAVSLGWAMQNFVLAELLVEEKGPNGWKPLDEHPLYTALDNNPWFDGDDLWQATVLSYKSKGNAYWLKALDGIGRPTYFLNLWPWQITPKRDRAEEFVSRYEYRPGDGKVLNLLPEEIIHFRFGLDPENELKGWDPFRALTQELSTDNEGSEYTWAVLRNAGVSCGALSPGDDEEWSPKQVDDFKAGMNAKTQGRQRGSWAVFSKKVQATTLGATPEQMALDTLGNREEARIAAAASIPAMVTGLLVGQQLKSYANMKEAREAGWEECLMPMGRTCGRALRRQLPEMIDKTRQRVTWDYSNISALQEDQNDLYKRGILLWEKELADRAEVRGMLKLEVDEARDRDVYYGQMQQERAQALLQQRSQLGLPESFGDRQAARDEDDGAAFYAARQVPALVGVGDGNGWAGKHQPGHHNQQAHGNRQGMRAASAADRKRFKVPPAWTGVFVTEDPESALQVVGYDSKGREQRRYSVAHMEAAAAAKFERGRAFHSEIPGLRKRIRQDAGRGRDEAAVLQLIYSTGFRVGSDAETGGKVQAFGASTLRREHVRVEGDRVHFDFIGKEGVRQQHTIRSTAVAADMNARLGKLGDRLFNTSDARVRDYLHSIDGEFKVKDFRTWKANAIAFQMVRDGGPPKSEKEFSSRRLDVGKRVSRVLGNRPQQALSSYIDPAVFGPWRAAMARGDE